MFNYCYYFVLGLAFLLSFASKSLNQHTMRAAIWMCFQLSNQKNKENEPQREGAEEKSQSVRALECTLHGSQKKTRK